ncbi:MAG: dihydroorotase family protein, partial [Candidatus Aenigmarchaeota archaeon]|nr:dihydroorotase family protein [Candidatus Aenigmarchaeota archaeon]
MSLAVENGRVYMGGKLSEKNILIENGKVKKITSSRIDAERTVNAKGNLVLPGFIDPHVHFREPGFTYKEDFKSGSFAAAAGGTTCILDMPNTKPPTLTVNDLDEKRELAKKSIVNFGFHFGSSLDNMEHVKKAIGVSSVKIFMDATTGNMLINDINIIREIISSVRICSFHAEGNNLEKAIDFGKSAGRRIYACHISTKTELGIINSNIKNVFCEATPHHMFLTKKNENN